MTNVTVPYILSLSFTFIQSTLQSDLLRDLKAEYSYLSQQSGAIQI